jgi:hypothetical protein
MLRRLALLQGLFYVITGVWPLTDIESFMWVTGPKDDIWLVRTVGLLITATGAVLLYAWKRREVSRPIAILAIANAAFLTFVDVFYSSLGVISKIYLLDAAVEVILIALWVYTLRPSNFYLGNVRANQQSSL